MYDLHAFIAPDHFLETRFAAYEPLQWGAQTDFPRNGNIDFSEAEIVLIGCGERRGQRKPGSFSSAPNAVREEFYKTYNWHPNVKLYDLGNVREGATKADTEAALRMVLQEIHEAGKTAIVLGGSHDLSLQQYEVFKRSEEIINASVVDMLVDLDETEISDDRSFLMEMLTGSPNFIGHYNHIGFQSYYVNPLMLETLDKIRFDFFRLGRVREHMDEMEPVLRSSSLFSFDINAVKFSDAPCNADGSPNGFAGDEACRLTRYAGMSGNMRSVGIYGFDETKDPTGLSAKLVAQMLWYFADGFFVRRQEAALQDRREFVEFKLQFTGNDILFLKSKRTNRWWMEMPDGSFEPCSYRDYLLACENEMPERWLRIQERG